MKRALWRCPRCRERFTSRNQWHSCGAFSLDDLFARSDPGVRRVFDRFLAMVKENGPVRVIPQRSRIAFQVRMRFAAVMPQKSSLKGHLVLASRHRSRCFTRVETISRKSHLHLFRLESENDLGSAFRRFVREAYQVGCQHHFDER